MDFLIERINPESGEYQGYDTVLESGDFKTISGPSEIGQKILNRLKVNFQEWYLFNGGVNWTRDVFDQPDGSVIAQDSVKKVILQTEGVIEIKEFRLLFNNPETRASDVFIKVKIETNEIIDVELGL